MRGDISWIQKNSLLKILVLLIFLYTINGYAQTTPQSQTIVNPTKEVQSKKQLSPKDSLAILIDTLTIDSNEVLAFKNDDIYAFEIDQLHYQMMSDLDGFTSDVNMLNEFGFPLDSIPLWPDSVIEARLKLLNLSTPIDLVYNDVVQAFINLYANRRRQMMRRVLGMAELYYPIFEAELDKYDMPLELRHLAVIESALTNTSRSRAGAVGLWQFMYATGKYFDLNIDSYIDERRDPIKSTQAAVTYLNKLYGMYGDWYLALAAYNAGPGNVNKAIRKSGGKKTYWEVRPYLPSETRSYVPAFIAANYIMNYASEHNIYPTHPQFTYKDIDTVHVKYPVSFFQISEVLCLEFEQLVFLNPQYKKEFIPFKGEGDVKTLVLPFEFMGTYIVNEEYIANYKSPSEIESEMEKIADSKEIIHKVRSGESLGLIANRYRVTVNEIKQWNNLTNNTIHVGNQLKIYSDVEYLQAKITGSTSVSKGYVYHTIKSGDTLWDIAKKYDGVSVSDILKLNNMSSRSVLKPGDKLKIKKS